MITLIPYMLLTMLSGVAMHFGLLTLDQAQLFSLGCFFTAAVVEVRLFMGFARLQKELNELEEEKHHDN